MSSREQRKETSTAPTIAHRPLYKLSYHQP
jgi:hypothetical protein